MAAPTPTHVPVTDAPATTPPTPPRPGAAAAPVGAPVRLPRHGTPLETPPRIALAEREVLEAAIDRWTGVLERAERVEEQAAADVPAAFVGLGEPLTAPEVRLEDIAVQVAHQTEGFTPLDGPALRRTLETATRRRLGVAVPVQTADFAPGLSAVARRVHTLERDADDVVGTDGSRPHLRVTDGAAGHRSFSPGAAARVFVEDVPADECRPHPARVRLRCVYAGGVATWTLPSETRS